MTVKRAGVFIGVDRTGGLPKLNDAANGAVRMAQWAKSQQMDPIVTLTDQGGKPVEIGDIKKAIEKIVDKGTSDQLVVYFAGHGINVGGTERWLLTDAPKDTGAAVNLYGSAELAYRCGIPHVVFISDACRTAAQGIRAQRVTGGDIFPNEAPAGPEKAVDQFWACLVGDPALEIASPSVTAKAYRALYTDELLDALNGNQTQILEADGAQAVVRPRPLKRYLPPAVTGRLKALKLHTKNIQQPDARITSDDTAWLARVALPPDGLPPKAAPGPDGKGGKGLFGRAPGAMDSMEAVSSSLVRAAVSGTAADLPREIQRARTASVAGAAALVESVGRASEAFGPPHFETQCGFKLRGAGLADAYSVRATVTRLAPDLARVDTVERPGANVLLVFEDGSGTVLPAIPGFIAALTVEDGRLVDVSYEPSDNSDRWSAFVKQALRLRTLRAIAASATRSGVFRLEGDDARRWAQELQSSKGTVPTLGVYAAYAYHNLRQRERIRRMSGYMREDLGARWFDVALLARELDGRAVAGDAEVFPFVPVLSQGWALLSAYRVKLPGALDGIQETLLPSLWTSFNAEGVGRMAGVMQSGEVKL